MRISNERVDTSVVNRNSNLLAQPTFFFFLSIRYLFVEYTGTFLILFSRIVGNFKIEERRGIEETIFQQEFSSDQKE